VVPTLITLPRPQPRRSRPSRSAARSGSSFLRRPGSLRRHGELAVTLDRRQM